MKVSWTQQRKNITIRSPLIIVCFRSRHGNPMCGRKEGTREKAKSHAVNSTSNKLHGKYGAFYGDRSEKEEKNETPVAVFKFAFRTGRH